MHKYTFFAVFLFRLRAWCPLYTQIKRFKRVLLFGCVVIPPLRKSRFVCAHIGQNRHIYPPSIFRLHFWLVPPPPFAQVDGVGCYREKFFLIFLISLSTRSDYTLILIFIFLIFARNLRMSGLRIIFFIFFVTSFLFGFVLDFIQNICRFNSLQVFSRYSSRLISLYFSRL